jgi:WxcM-like, C-terminal
MPIADCKLIELPIVREPRGNLTFIEGEKDVPFEIKRVYYLYDVPGGAERGGHAHRRLKQLIVPLAGSFDVTIDDGFEARTIHLRRASQGLLMPTMIWREISEFTSGSVCLVLASEHYDEADYFRDYEEFRAAAKLTHHSSQTT